MTPRTAPELRVLERRSLGELAADWDRIAWRSSLPSPFCRSWWVDHAAGATPVVLCCLDGDRLVGGAAFEVDTPGRAGLRIERVRSLGQGSLAPDHLDVVAAPEDAERVVRAVLGWLRRPGNRLVDLDGLAAGGHLGRALAAHWIDRVAAPWADLRVDDEADPAAAYLSARPGRVRSTVDRTRKRLERAGCTVTTVPPDRVEAALGDLERLHDDRWGDESEFLDAWDRFSAAARAATVEDLRITEVRTAEGEVVATELDLLTPLSASFYQAGRSPEREWRGAGSVLRAQIVRDAVADGRLEYDLLRGDESYKDDWATDRRAVLRVRFGSGPLGRAAATSAGLWRHAAPTYLRIRDRVRAVRSGDADDRSGTTAPGSSPPEVADPA